MPTKPTEHLVKIFSALEASSSRWLSVVEIAELSKVNYNTTKAHIRSLARRRLLDVIEMHPANLYKLSDNIANDNFVIEIKGVAGILSKT
jgi:DNA-binding IclR family transcriptional regulator